jgi:hypothetical protein
MWEEKLFLIQPNLLPGLLYFGKEFDEYFDAEYYAKNNPKASESRLTMLQHYLSIGWKEGYSPSNLFDVKFYLLSNPDVKAAGVEPLSHYIMHGKKEGRLPISQ